MISMINRAMLAVLRSNRIVAMPLVASVCDAVDTMGHDSAHVRTHHDIVQRSDTPASLDVSLP